MALTYNEKSASLSALTSWRQCNCKSSASDQCRNCGHLVDLSSFHSWKVLTASFSPVPEAYSWYALHMRIYRHIIVTWCARRVRLRWLAVSKDSATPCVTTPALQTVSAHPVPVSHLPCIFQDAISTWSPPSIKTKRSSSYTPPSLHWISLAKANNGWSTAITGVWEGLTCATAALITLIECAIIANEWAFSVNIGKSEIMAGSWLDNDVCVARYAAQETLSFFWSSSFDNSFLAFSSQSCSSFVSSFGNCWE